MSSEQARELREQGIQAAKAGQKDQARQLLMQSIKLDANNEAAWLWLASVARDRRERVACLQKLLQINPNNEMGLKALRALGESPPPPESKPALVPSPEPVARPASTPLQRRREEGASPQAEGIPVPDPDRIEAAQAQLDDVLQEYLTPVTSDHTWVHKTRRRAGERDILVLRLQVTGMILAFLAVLGLAGFVFFSTNAEARKLLFKPTWTISPTPTNTATATPGFTPTPSPTLDTTENPTYTPSPTISSSLEPGDPTRQPRPTQPYLPEIPERVLVDAVALINQGKYSEAIPTLEVERALATRVFNPNPYYLEALAEVDSGNPTQAQDLLSEAEARLEEVSEDQGRPYKALINVGYAYADLALAEKARDDGNRNELGRLLDDVQQRTEDVIAFDQNFALAYVLLARRYAFEENYDEALTVLNQGLAVPKLFGDLNLRVEKAEIYYRQGEYALASQEVFEVLYINPFSEQARLLQIRSALASNQPGLAVIYTQQYLFFFPGSTLGYKLLGDARVAEGNSDQALDAYTQALQGDENDPAFLEALLARAQLYGQQRRFDLARDDLTQALSLQERPDIQALRMTAAYNAGNYSIALNDADELLGKGVVPDSQLHLLQARVLIDQARSGSTQEYQQALSLLNNVSDLPADLQPVADEYRARASFQLGDFDGALQAITRALTVGETGSRRYLRGLILEGRSGTEEDTNAEDDRVAAIRDFEWVVTWSQVYPYSFFADARRRLERLKAPPPEPTPTPKSTATPRLTPTLEPTPTSEEG